MIKRAEPRSQRDDQERLAGVLFIFIGRLLLIFSLFFLGTSRWLGFPNTTTPLRLVMFGVVGLILGTAGYRLASGTWVGSFQVLHESAAIAGLVFLVVFLRKQLNANRPPSPPSWVVGIAALAPISWWLVARRPRRRRRKK